MTDTEPVCLSFYFGLFALTLWVIPDKLSILTLEKWKNSYFLLFGTGFSLNHKEAKQHMKIINCCTALEKNMEEKEKSD